MAISPDLQRVHELLPVHGTMGALKIAKAEARKAAVDRLSGDLSTLDPRSADFAEDLRDLLGGILDLLED